ncbi:hypothetical protein ABT324_18830 [Saccharopolyspora sp. NPDC000359]|uniref:hypothetical protein n=1 Tax=Saccharopolyspora sp. NPDC000359 TaxID=3154251 RepID=UPI00331ECA21
MDEVDEVLLRAGAAKAVCAHIGIGSDEREARVARDRLDRTLAAYRVALLGEAQAPGTAAPR